MARARIYQQGKPATQSGRARANLFILEWESERPKRPDPLMGWAGGADTAEQLRLSFPTLEAALAYARTQGLEVEVVPPQTKRLILKSYADNFR
ncbi:ETC complex I subunit [Thermaurantiacus sp.]